jgi:HEAT repeat protein
MAPPEDFYRLLVDGLADLQPRVRAESLRRLQDVPVERALPIVVSYLGSQEPELQAVLLDYLGSLSQETLDAFLDGVLGMALEPQARRLLARVVGRSQHPDATALLEAFLEEDDAAVRRAAVDSLPSLPGRHAQQLVASALQDPDVQVRCGAVDAAAGLGATAGAPLVRLALQDPSVDVRRRAVLRLARIALGDALPDFKVASRDSEPRVRAAALAALLLEGSQPVEDWIGLHDVAAIAMALRELGGAEAVERRLTAARAPEDRVGALKTLFFRDAKLRTRALAAARVDPAPRVQAVGRHLEEILAGWLEDPDAAACLADAATPEPSEEAAANAAPPLPPLPNRPPTGSPHAEAVAAFAPALVHSPALVAVNESPAADTAAPPSAAPAAPEASDVPATPATRTRRAGSSGSAPRAARRGRRRGD